MQLVLEGAIRPPSEINRAVTPEIDAACMRALALWPEGRSATAADFAEALENAAEKSHIAIATSRAVGAFVKALPPAPMRSAESTLTPSISGARPAMHSSSSSSVSHVSLVSQSRRDPVTGTDTRSALSGATPAIPEALPPARGAGGSRMVLAAAAAALISGVAVWALTRGAATPTDAPGATAIASSLVAAPSPEASAPTPPIAIASSSPSSAPSSRSGSSKPAPTTTTPARPGRPGGRPSPTAFRPEEP